MKSARFQYNYRDSASKLHIAIGETLRNSSIFKNYSIFQEYPVYKICPTYQSVHWFDWVVLDIQLVIEAQGVQHYKGICFGGISEEEAHSNFLQQRARDKRKMNACLDAGFTFIEIPYWDIDKINDEYIWALYLSNRIITLSKVKPILVESEWKIKQRIHAKEVRHAQYEKAKRRLKNEV